MMIRRARWALLVGLVVGVGIWGYFQAQGRGSVPKYRTAVVERGPLTGADVVGSGYRCRRSFVDDRHHRAQPNAGTACQKAEKLGGGAIPSRTARSTRACWLGTLGFAKSSARAWFTFASKISGSINARLSLESGDAIQWDILSSSAQSSLRRILVALTN